MHIRTLTVGALLALATLPALAQAPDPVTGARAGHTPGIGTSLPLGATASNIGPGDGRSLVAPTLPGSPVGPDGSARDYLRAARAALLAGRTGEAQQALEMAETRMLDRVIAPDTAIAALAGPALDDTRDARRAIGRHDNTRAVNLIDHALAG